MKKLLMFSTMLCIGAMAFGQKQQTDSKTLEVNFTPFGNSPISINGIKFRKFTDDYNAIRLEVSLGMNSDKTRSLFAGENGLQGDDANETTFSTASGFNISVRPGIEKHFDGTNRLSPYVGAAFNVDYSSSKTTNEFWSPDSRASLIDNNVDNDFSDFTVWEQETTNGSFGFGLMALAGMDFYFADNVYLGVEFGLGLGLNSQSNTKYSASNDEAWALYDHIANDTEIQITSADFESISAQLTENTNWGTGSFDDEGTVGGVPGSTLPELENIETRDDAENGNSFNLGTMAQGALRLGFIF